MGGWRLRVACGAVAAALATGVGQAGETRATPFAGATFEASGVAAVEHGTAVLMVADSRPGEVIWMEVAADGTQKGQVQSVSLGTEVKDPEGITTDGTWFYVVGSQSRGAEGPGLLRFRFEPDSRRASDVQTVDELASFLKERLPELREPLELDIEGLAWHPARNQLLLGLRSPLLDGSAIVVPLTLKTQHSPLARANLATGGVLRLDLGGQGIRGLEYDHRTRSLQVIAGPSGDQDGEFRLLQWNGEAGSSLRAIASFDGELKPEGVTRAGALTLIVCDTSRFVVLR